MALYLMASIGFIIALCIDPTMFCDEKHELWKDPEFEFSRQSFSMILETMYIFQPVTLQAIKVSKSKFSSLIRFRNCANSICPMPSHPSISAKI